MMGSLYCGIHYFNFDPVCSCGKCCKYCLIDGCPAELETLKTICRYSRNEHEHFKLFVSDIKSALNHGRKYCWGTSIKCACQSIIYNVWFRFRELHNPGLSNFPPLHLLNRAVDNLIQSTKK